MIEKFCYTHFVFGIRRDFISLFTVVSLFLSAPNVMLAGDLMLCEV